MDTQEMVVGLGGTIETTIQRVRSVRPHVKAICVVAVKHQVRIARDRKIIPRQNHNHVIF